MYDIGAYYSAKTVEEAIELMKEHPDAKLISGGSDVLIQVREGKLAGCKLIGIRGIKELQKIEQKEDGTIMIGAGMTFCHITAHPLIQKNIPVLGEAVDQVGGPQIRNIGTIGGNICNGAVSADSVPTCFSLEAVLRIAGPEGIRTSSMEDFYLGPGRVNLKPAEILTHVMIPKKSYDGYTGHYIKYSMRNAMDIATLSCSVVCKADREKNLLEDMKMTFGVAAPIPLRVKETEKKGRGQLIEPELFNILAESVRKEINPRDSWRASKSFRLQIGGEIAKRALYLALMKQGIGTEQEYEKICGEV